MMLAMCSVQLHTSNLSVCVQNTVYKNSKDSESVAAFQLFITLCSSEAECYLSGWTCINFLKISLIIEIYIQYVK